MLIECLTKRVGVTPIVLGGQKYPFQFQQVPFARRGEATTSVCDIANPEHQAFLLGLNPKTGEKMRNTNFRPYDPDVTKKELDADRLKEKLNVFKGLSIEKWQNKGYVVKSVRGKGTEYAASNTGFTEETGNLVPWEHEVEAFAWLKDQIESGEIEGFEAESKAEPPEDKDILIAQKDQRIAELEAKLAVSGSKPKPGRPKKQEAVQMVNLEI